MEGDARFSRHPVICTMQQKGVAALHLFRNRRRVEFLICWMIQGEAGELNDVEGRWTEKELVHNRASVYAHFLASGRD